MIDAKLNTFKLLTNYLFTKTIDLFLHSKTYDQLNLGLISAQIDGLESFNEEIIPAFKFKLCLSYLISMIGRYLNKDDEEDYLKEIVDVLFNDVLVKVIPCGLVTQLRGIIYKKVSVLLVSNSLQKHKIYFTKFVADNSNDLLDEPSTPGYSNEALYSDVSEQINQYASNSSLLFEISRCVDLDNEEDDLIHLIVSMKKRKKLDINRNESQIEQQKSKKARIDESADESFSKENMSKSSIVITRTKITKSNVLTTNTDENIPSEDKPKNVDICDQDESIESNQPRTSKEPQKTISSKIRLIKKADLIADSLLSSNDLSKSHSSPSKEPADSVSELDFDQSPIKSVEATKEEQRKRLSKVVRKIKDEKPVVKTATRNLARNDFSISIMSESDSDDEIVSKNKTKRITESDDDMEQKKSDDSDLETNITKSLKPKHKKVKWTENETLYLVIGVEIYGKGSWANILSRFKSKFMNRTSVHLKDKYRNIERSLELKTLQKQAHVIIASKNYS